MSRTERVVKRLVAGSSLSTVKRKEIVGQIVEAPLETSLGQMPGFSLKLFLRVISRNGEVYLLKVITLAIAFASSTLVILFSLNEFGYDRFHNDPNSVFRVLERNTSELLYGNRLSNKIPFETYKRLASSSRDSLIVSRVIIMNGITIHGDDIVLDTKIHSSDTEITHIFLFDVADGSLDDFREKKRQVLLNTSTARALFGTTRASGKNISVTSNADTLQFTIAAIYEDFPENAHEEFNLLVSFDTVAIQTLGFDHRKTGVYGRVINSEIPTVENHLNSQITDNELHYLLQPLPEIYFGPRVSGEDSQHGDSYSVFILICITGLILFLALTSYTNLTTLTLPYRSKELAIKKLAGTNLLDLFFTFFKESLAIVVVSFLLGVTLLILTSDLLEPILSVSLVALASNGEVTLIFIIAGIMTSLVVAPLFLTFKFIRASPNRLLSSDKITFPSFKRTITVLQLGISIFLIASSMVIKRQINYSLLKEPGRNYEQVVYLSYPQGLTEEGVANIRSGWKKHHPNIVDVIAISQLPDRISSKELNSPFYAISVDPYFPGFFDLNMLDGNWFKPNAGDSILVLNELGARHITKTETKNVIGIIDDISSQFNQPQKPTKFKIAGHSNYNYLCIRVLEVDVRRTMNFLSTFFDGAPVHFLNKRFDAWLKYQDRLNTLSQLLAIISGVLSCCAIYGLSISLLRDKLKQIAVHKICGANTFNITLLLARQFVKETLITILIFAPITYIFATELLRNFVYATHFQWQDPLFPLLYCVLVVTVLCGFQALSLSRRDLTSALKD
jgi:putative ABC transport system permease protein